MYQMGMRATDQVPHIRASHVATDEPFDPDLTLPRVAAALRATARAASAFSLCTGVLVLLGWAAGGDVLHRLGLAAITPMMAAAFICLGCSLGIAIQRASSPMRMIADAFALVAILIGLSRLAGFVGLFELDVDRLLFHDALAPVDAGRLNQVPPNTALNFALIGIALVAIDRRMRKFRRLGQMLAVTTAMTSLLALMGYAYGLGSLYGVGYHVAMPLPTAAAFLIVAIGVLCARPADGIMAVISSDTSGGAMIRRLLPAVLIVPAALGALRLVGQQGLLFDTAFGLWLLVVSIMTVFAALVGWSAQLLYRSDVDRANAALTLAHQASQDALTQLPNRRLFIERLTAALEQSKESGVSVAVLFIDMDAFKVINDSLGHFVGDELLVAAGRRIEECAGAPNMVARLSGDEFTVLLRGLSRERVIDLSDRIRHAFDRPFTIGLHEVFTSLSIGIAFSDDTLTPQDLIRHADIAMYRAKQRGKARYEVFHSTMDLAAKQRQRLEAGLRRALAQGELRVYYQPEVEIDTGNLVGMEALVRWHHPERGVITPSEFIAVAEETGLIVPIGRWVLFEACRQAKEWQTMYRRDLALMVSVNLSGKHLQQATLVDEVREVIETTGINPGHLIIEITETVAMAGAETTIEILSSLKSLGVLLAIDDFGTGFSSLAYLKRFPVDLLKIDKSFIAGVARHGHDTAIVEAIIALGHALGLRVIAEGVERPEQLHELRSLGSELGQGFFFGQPLSNDAERGMPSLLEAHRLWTADRVT